MSKNDRDEIKTIEISGNQIKEIFQITDTTLRKHRVDPNFPKPTPSKFYNLIEVIRYFKNLKSDKPTTTTDAKLRLLELQSKKLELQIREQENQLVEIDHVKDTIQKITQKIKQTLEQLPRKIAKKTENRTEMEVEIIAKDVIAGEIQKLLKEIDSVQGE